MYCILLQESPRYEGVNELHLYRQLIPVHSKATPLQAWADPDGSRRVRLPDFKTIGT